VSELRDRFRTQIRDEVKQVALAQLARGGPSALSVNAIAKELGVSGPALYRYFANRDELLTELITDAYRDLAASLRSTSDLRGMANAYWTWALAQPERYRLLFAAPVTGYDAHSVPLVTASQGAMDALIAVVRELEPGLAAAGRFDGALADQLERWLVERGVDHADAPAAERAVLIWAQLHGLVSLEIGGNFASMGLDGALLFNALLDGAVTPGSIPSRR
jgi:AcrR family transcriptional regulator